MPLEVIYVTRHGFRSNWVVDPNTGDYQAQIRSPTGIDADPALTAHGVDQARDLAAHLATLDPPIEAIYSSPYYRCLQTIAPLVELKMRSDPPAGVRHAITPPALISIRPEYGLCEWFGSADFDQPRPAAPEVLKEMFPAYDARYESAVMPSAHGESLDELHDRTAVVARAIIEQCDREGVRAVVLCTHAAVVIALGRVLTGIMPDNVEEEDFRAFTCGLSIFRRRKVPHLASQDDQPAGNMPIDWRNGRGVGGGWTCEANSDCSHLPGGEERGWTFSGDEDFIKTQQKPQNAACDNLASAAGPARGLAQRSPKAARNFRL